MALSLLLAAALQAAVSAAPPPAVPIHDVPQAALTPPLVLTALPARSWNGFEMRFNTSLLLRTARALQKNGLAAKGYTLITYGGASYPGSLVNKGLPPIWNSTNVSNNKYVTVRNSTGFYQIDPGKFPGAGSSASCASGDAQFMACMKQTGSWLGHNATHQWSGQPELCGCKNGNNGVKQLSEALHRMGFGFGSYAGSGGLCQVEACSTAANNASKFQGFIDQDFDVLLREWQSDYIMIDSVGATYPGSRSDPEYFRWNADMMKKWREKIDSANLDHPVILHSCHNGCATQFTGPTLVAAKCDESDPRQRWMVSTNTTPAYMSTHVETGLLHDASTGLCAGCVLDMHYGGPRCANDAVGKPATGYGLGQQACISANSNSMSHGTRWNYSAVIKRLINTDNEVLEVLPAPGNQVISAGVPCMVTPISTHFEPASCIPCCGPYPPQEEDLVKTLPGCAKNVSCASLTSGTPNQRWTQGAADAQGYTQMRSVGRPGLCLASSGLADVKATPLPEWCQTMNMWRSSTDTLAVWGRLMQQVESLVGLGNISGPGHWSFGDCLELGVPCSLTWEESKTHLALFAVTSQPLLLGNDLREGYVQPRLIDIIGNDAMLAINQEYNGFAGDRVTSTAPGQEVWAKPLHHGRVGVVIFNRNGSTPKCWNHASKNVSVITCPCDDNTSSPDYGGAQPITFNFSVLPSAWLLGAGSAPGAEVECALADVWTTAGKPGGTLGRFKESYLARDVPPHGVRFLMVSNCTASSRRAAVKTDDQPAHCPQFHLRSGGDPSGPTLLPDGTWHFFPIGGGWGHCSSKDLIHWDCKQQCNTSSCATTPGCLHCQPTTGWPLPNTGALSVTPSGSYIMQANNFNVSMKKAADATQLRLWEDKGVVGAPENLSSAMSFSDTGRALKLKSGYYVPVGVRGPSNAGGGIHWFKAEDDTLQKLTEKSFLFTVNVAPNGSSIGPLLECPDVFALSGKTVVLGSLPGVPINTEGTSHWWVGSLSDDDLTFTAESTGRWDHGLPGFSSIYAAKSGTTALPYEGPFKRRVLFGFGGWRASELMAKDCGGYYATPREITLSASATLLQQPAQELLALRQGKAVAGPAIAAGGQVEVLVQCALPALPPTTGRLGVTTLQTPSKNQSIFVGYAFGKAGAAGVAAVPAALGLYGNTSRTDSAPLAQPLALIELRVLVDGGLVETFFGGGEASITTATGNTALASTFASSLVNDAKLECNVSSWVLLSKSDNEDARRAN